MAVIYNRVNFKNRVVQYPRSYTEANNAGGGITHTPAPGTVVQEGVLPNEENMNRMDKGISDCATEINGILDTIGGIQNTLLDHGNRIGTNEQGLKSVRAVNDTQDDTLAGLREDHDELAADEGALRASFEAHEARRDNPHEVTAEQLGLGNVPNVATNDQRPTFTEATGEPELESGEKFSDLLGKLARALKALWEHIHNRDNPHQVTKAQVGLGLVPNVTTNGQTPTYTVAGSDQEMVSGETLSTAFGKIARAVSRLWEHLADKGNPHEVNLFQAAGITFPDQPNALGTPDKIGTFTGNGASAGTLTVNGKICQGQMIDLGFAPKAVAIIIPNGAIDLGMGNTELKSGYDLLELLFGKKYWGVAIFGPLKNYYHTECGIQYKSALPETVLRQNHGGAVVYGNGFIVQSFQNKDVDAEMHMNAKGVVYNYLAWKQ